MAVDIKQLRIGAHIEVNGVRRAVFGLGCGRVSYLPHPVSSVALSVLSTEVNPIPITPELLMELGFELTGDWEEYKIYSKKNVAVRLVGECIYAKVEPNLGALRDIKYLHELEAFIFLTLGKDLIEE